MMHCDVLGINARKKFSVCCKLWE